MLRGRRSPLPAGPLHRQARLGAEAVAQVVQVFGLVPERDREHHGSRTLDRLVVLKSLDVDVLLTVLGRSLADLLCGLGSSF